VPIPPAAPRCVRELQRLVVAVLLIATFAWFAADGRDDVPRAAHHREPLGLPQRGHRLVEASFLRVGDPLSECTSARLRRSPRRAVRRRPARWCSRTIAVSPTWRLTKSELVVGENRSAGNVGALRLLQGPPESAIPRDELAAPIAKLPVQAPEL